MGFYSVSDSLSWLLKGVWMVASGGLLFPFLRVRLRLVSSRRLLLPPSLLCHRAEQQLRTTAAGALCCLITPRKLTTTANTATRVNRTNNNARAGLFPQLLDPKLCTGDAMLRFLESPDAPPRDKIMKCVLLFAAVHHRCFLLFCKLNFLARLVRFIPSTSSAALRTGRARDF